MKQYAFSYTCAIQPSPLRNVFLISSHSHVSMFIELKELENTETLC